MPISLYDIVTSAPTRKSLMLMRVDYQESVAQTQFAAIFMKNRFCNLRILIKLFETEFESQSQRSFLFYRVRVKRKSRCHAICAWEPEPKSPSRGTESQKSES